jgi:hypothetical protein
MSRTIALALAPLLLAAACGSDSKGTSRQKDEGGVGGAHAAGGAAGAAGTTGTAGVSSSAGGASDSGARPGDSGAPDAGYTPPDYSNAANWLCLPGAPNDACHENLDATVVAADGTLTVEPHVFATDPPIDCFYVYPTISDDPTPNSDLVPDKTELDCVKQQAARFTRVCKVYAPVYRQVTLAALFGSAKAAPNAEMAYEDVLTAWNYYLAKYNAGRPFVLIGHSQGSAVLKRLVQEHVDDDAAMRGKLVSALLIGGGLAVPDGADVGLDFQNIPVCNAPTDTGCLVGYSSFRSTAPPPADSYFGKVRSGTGVVVCNNPAALSGGKVYLDPYFPVGTALLNTTGLAITTPYVRLPNFLEGQCVTNGGFHYLEVTVHGDPSDPRPDDIGGDITPEWGLHLVDVHIAMGDLVNLVATQAASLRDH